MIYKARLIGAGFAASLLAAASIAAAQTGGPTTQGTDQQTFEARTKAADHMTRMVEQCHRMMGHASQ
jgi:hypothetical protein